MAYRAVLFDLFDTLVRFDRERMPEIQINGKLIRSSAGMLHSILQTQAPQIGLEACYEALGASWREAERLRALDHREVSALDRFACFFRELGLVEPELAEEAGEAVERRHLAVIERAQALGLPPARPERLVACLQTDLGRLRLQDAVQHAGRRADELAVDLDLGHALAIEADQRVEEIEEDRAVAHQRGFLPE